MTTMIMMRGKVEEEEEEEDLMRMTMTMLMRITSDESDDSRVRCVGCFECVDYSP